MLSAKFMRRVSLVAAIVASLLGCAVPAQAAKPRPDCPPTISCRFIPAAYQAVTSVEDYGNYDVANRPADGIKISGIVWHDIEGDCASAIKQFRDPTRYVSAHYLVCAEPNGTIDVVQMVETKNIAWHAGNYDANMHTIGVELAGHAASGDYSLPLYQVAAKLGIYLVNEFGIQRDAQHMGGHQNVPPPNSTNVGAQHMDPGPFFNWELFYQLLGVSVSHGNPLSAQVVTVAPTWQLNAQPVTGCFPDEADQCANTSTRPTSIVYVHTQPKAGSPLVSDPLLGAGTTDIGNEVAKVYYGQQFVARTHQVATDGIWYQIDYDGQMGWIFSPWTDPTIFAGSGTFVTPRLGLSSIPVYGRAYPQASTYPAGFTGPSNSSLDYRIPAGQRYVVTQSNALTQWYNNATINNSQPYDHVVFTSTDPNDQYLAIQFYGRYMYVKRSDVVPVG